VSGDDLTPLFDPALTGPSMPVSYRQGTILTFDPVTLENTVLVGGAVMSNMPLNGVGEATLLVPGATVGIMVVGDAAKGMFIDGRVVYPNTADATDAVSLLNSQIYTDFIAAGETCTSATYGDLATVGPQVTVPVGATGRILIVATAQIQWVTGNFALSTGDGRFDLEFTGANSRSPNETNDPLVGVAKVGVQTSGGITNINVAVMSVTAQAVFDSLNSGNTTITMKYRNPQAAFNDTDFFRRTLTVFKL
jgi:hypothetical protein